MKFLPATAFLMLFTLMARGEPARYTIIVDESTPERLRVESEMSLEGETIGFLITSSPQLENGQADLVEDLLLRIDGEEVPLEALGQGDWRVPQAKAGQRVRLSYTVRLEHDQYAWGPGIDEVAYRTDEGFFTTGASILAVPGFEMAEGAEIQFELPDGWHASTPWKQQGDVFFARDAMAMIRNCLFVGTHRTETAELDGFRFTMVLGGDLYEKRQHFVDAMAPILPMSQAAFGGMPNENNYLVVFNRGDRADGGAFNSSYSMLLKGAVNESSSVIWGHGVAHELIHFWNGHAMAPQSQDEEWFKEGFTDYFTLLARSRSGLDSVEDTHRKLENMLRRYIIAKMLMQSEATLQEAGHDKHRQRFLVYGGGALVGLVLDIRIREATGNAKGIDDFLREMYTDFGRTDSRYDLDDIVRIASSVSGEDQSEFFARYVSGRDYLDAGPYLERLGFQLDTMVDEFYVSVAQDATADQLAVQRSMFGR